jgi:hypothetical protein
MADAPKQDDPAQSQRFLDMAREVEAEEEGGAFENVFMKVASQPAASKERLKATKP